MKSFLQIVLSGLFLFNHLFVMSLSAQTIENIPPLHIPLLLSGNFGELRATHFHSGVDLKTKGLTGLPVLCVNDGVLARIKISPVGYGNALYIEHPDGMTTVYGHLSHYSRKITEIARRLQYQQESFEIDEDTRSLRVYLKKGDTIAYSGNTGSSGGPHLHFEYRNTYTEHPVNPLYYVKIKDGIAPHIRALYLYESDEQGRISAPKRYELKPIGGNHYSAGKLTMPSGKTGIGLYITDAMNDSGNKLGVYKISVRVGGRDVFSYVADSCAFEQTVLVNTLKDFRLYRRNNETVYRCFGNYLPELFGVNLAGDGYICLKENEELPVEIQVTDINGNQSMLTFRLVGKAARKMLPGNVLAAGKSYLLTAGEYSLALFPKSLFNAVDRFAAVDSAGIFTVSFIEEPLYEKARLKVQGLFSAKAVLCRITEKGEPEALPTLRDSSGLVSLVNVLGRYQILEDTVQPTVDYLGNREGRLNFRIRDALTGIATYRGEVNGHWCLFEYDAKTDILSCRKTEPAFVKGQVNRIVIKVIDKVGNVTEKSITVNL